MTEEEFKEEASQLAAVAVIVFVIGIAFGAAITLIWLN